MASPVPNSHNFSLQENALTIPVSAQLGILRTKTKIASGIVLEQGKAIIPITTLPANEKAHQFIEDLIKQEKLVVVRKVKHGKGFREIGVFKGSIDEAMRILLYLVAMKGKSVKHWPSFEEFNKVIDLVIPELREMSAKVLLNYQKITPIRVKTLSHLLYDTARYLLKNKEVQKMLEGEVVEAKVS